MKLPIDDHLPGIMKELRTKQNILVQSSAGSGKTTRIPPYLKTQFKNIIVVEPRRIAAIYAASRIAEEKNWVLGKEVGYEVRFDSQKSADTSILFLTEALLAKKIMINPQMENIDLIIFDEFHERSLWTDLSIGHLKELQILGSSIKMLFLSATIDQKPLRSFFDDIGVIDIELPRFPIEILYQRKPFRYYWNEEFESNLTSALTDVMHRGKNQILVFLPGLKEIRNACRLLENHSKFKNFPIEILHGSIPLDHQRAIVRNEKNSASRIILATNIAESSLTIAGVTAVVDSGLQREASYNADYEETQLSTKKISLFSAIQRQGRANRLGPGVCFKMWTETDEKSMEKVPVSDIKKSSLFDLGLFLVNRGHWPLSQFTWFEPPAPSILIDLERTLTEGKLISTDPFMIRGKSLTSLGQLILELNLSYENALFLLFSHCFYFVEKTALLIAILESGYAAPDSHHATHSTLLEAADDLNRGVKYPHDINKRVSQIVAGFNKSRLQNDWKKEIYNLFPSDDEQIFLDSLDSSQRSEKTLEMILIFSYRSRLCKRRKQDGLLSNRGITTRAKEVVIGENKKANLLPPFEYFINFKTVVDANQMAKCYGYHFIEPMIFDLAIRPFAQRLSRIEFSESKQQFYKIVELVYKKIVIDTLTQESLNPKELLEKTKDILISQKVELLFTLPKISTFLRRLQLVNQTRTEDIEIDWELVLEQEIINGLTLKNRFDWDINLEDYLSFEHQKLLKIMVPQDISISGLKRNFYVHYPNNEAPFIESKLQHFLGLNTHPTILNNTLKLKIVLLGPHGRPIQITNDLPGFWKTSYPEIRKEMKGRYPKHPWPEDPTSFKN